jgi:hypothetical protein
MKPQQSELKRRDFLSSLTTAAGLLAPGLRPAASAAAMPSLSSEGAGIPAVEPGRDLYRIHRLSESGMLEMYTRLLEDACRYAARDWKTSSFDPAAGYWGDGVADGNGGTRTVASMLLVCQGNRTHVAIRKLTTEAGQRSRDPATYAHPQESTARE